MSSTTTSTGTGTTAGNHDDEYKSGIGYHHPTTTTVEQLLRECWQYHQEQEIIRCHRHYNQAGDDDVVVVVGIASTDSSHGMMNGNLPSIAPVVPEVPTPTPTPAPNFVMPSIADTTETARLPPTTTNDGHLEPRTHHIASAREQARDIARRFPPAPANVAVPKVTIPEKTDTADHTIYSTPSNTDINLPVGGGDDDDYIHQRQIGFQREEQRKQKAMIRNFQYLYDQQQHRMAQLNARILPTTSTPTTTTTTWTSTSATTATATSTRNHTTTLPTMTATTTKRHRGDSNRCHDDDDDDDDDCDTDRYHDQQQQQQQHDDNTTTTMTTTNATTGTVSNTVAIYISTESTVSTVASSTSSSNSDQPPPLHLYWNESYLQQLFQTYGTIRNIYLYRHRNKRKGRLGDYKGDGIIVYKLSRNAANDDDDDQVDDTLRRQRQTLIELICGQMNGAELPCGTILHVEPATDSTSTGTTNTATTNISPEPLEPTMVAGASPVASRSSTNKEVVAGTMSTTLHPNDGHNHDDGHADAEDDDLDEFFDSL